jgi:hypothetical protein
MALKAVVESLDAVPEIHRTLYIQTDDGKFKLDAEGVEDVSGLKSALEKERAERRQARADLEKFKDIDPVKYHDAVARLNAIDEKELIDKGDLDKIVESRVKALKDRLEGELTNERTSKQTMQQRLEELLIDSEVQRESLPLVVDTAMGDVVRRAREIFSIVDGHSVPMRDGKIVYGEDGVTPLTIRDWLAGLAKTAPHLFKQSQGGGAGTGGGRGTGGGSSELDKLPPAERLKIVRRQAAGQK